MIRAFFLILVIVCCFAVNDAMSQISPGDLSDAHAHLEGISNCTKCHELGKKVLNSKCLDCHKELNERITANAGFHVSSEVKTKSCIKCHSDHHGRKFEMIRFDKDKFDHQLTGYKLEGAHVKQSCADCHKPENIENIKIREKKSTFLGLSTSCNKCHEDVHQNTLSVACNECHDFEAFKPASYFDHKDTDFTLKGKHKEVECIECHELGIKNNETFQFFAGTAFTNCTSCHTDVHDNKFGQNCTKCHSEQSFHSIKGLNNFDHSVTKFPLAGKHRNVSCKTCHKGKYTDPLQHKYCIDCHDDFHKGQFVDKGNIRDCADCHNINGFNESSFTIEQHGTTAFALEGAHIATPCFACHKKSGQWQFKNIGKSCIDCHNDIHENYISEQYYPDASCRSCHEVDIWNNISFNHSLTDFELEGAHQDQSCRSCHFFETEAKVEQRFSNLSSECLLCHVDVHWKQFDEYGATGCLNCHDFEAWIIINFDHSKTKFTLDGAHSEVTCLECHKEVFEQNVSYINYKIEDYRCEACH
jgi:hypothetical protein